MSLIVSVGFKVTRVDDSGNRREPFSRLFVLEAVNLDRTYSNLFTEPSYAGFINLIGNIKKVFPEITRNEGLSPKFKLVYPGNYCTFRLFYVTCPRKSSIIQVCTFRASALREELFLKFEFVILTAKLVFS